MVDFGAVRYGMAVGAGFGGIRWGGLWQGRYDIISS